MANEQCATPSPNAPYSINTIQCSDIASERTLWPFSWNLHPKRHPDRIKENFYDVLVRISCASSVRSLTIEDSRISVHDILKLFAMKQLEHLSVDGFNNPIAVVPEGKIHHSQLESLAISASRNPTGRHIDLLFKRVPNLRKLGWHFDFSWIVDENKSRETLSPVAISKALSPLRHKLVESNISLEPAPFRNDGTELNLSNFLRLRKLKIHDRVLLPSAKASGSVVSRTSLDSQLSRCLPVNLDTLDVRKTPIQGSIPCLEKQKVGDCSIAHRYVLAWTEGRTAPFLGIMNGFMLSQKFRGLISSI